MRWKIIIILLLLVFLTSCDSLNKFKEDWKNAQFISPYSKTAETNNSANKTNTTNTTAEIEISLEYNKGYPNIFIMGITSILVMENNKSYIIDVPKENPKIINYINRFNLKESEFIVSTINKEEHNGGIQYIVSKAPPKKIYDNGIDDEYRIKYTTLLNKYNFYWNRTPTSYPTVLSDFKYGNFEFFVPYSHGLSAIKEENSIVVYYNKEFLYMSDCYGGCEDRIPPISTTFLVLANGGKCPTNSFDFILNTGAKYVIGEEVCPDLIENLDYIGINRISLDGRVMQIILEEDFIRIRYE